MLPIRISVEGFMSYRDRTVFDFEGARLWMLSGANGAGKSTVFDALRWVLFGVHRAGKQKPEQLIHHEADKLVVEVELELGEEIYKLKRTLGREGARATWDVARWAGNAWESVAGTSMSGEYNRWIKGHIGLTDEAFCASVYLSQGRADAILNADAEARYELLSQLVDLEVYEQWHERAEERRSEARAQMTEARRRWEISAAPAPELVEELRERAVVLERELGEMETQIRGLDSARSEAGRWEEWESLLKTLDAQRTTVGGILEEKEAIERDFARWNRLQSQKGAIDTLWQSLSWRDELRAQMGLLRPQLELAQGELGVARERSGSAQSAVEAAQNAANEANVAWAARLSEVAELAPQRAQIEQRSRLIAQRGEQARLYGAFEGNLDERLAGAERDRDKAREVARVLPLWRRFDVARRAFALAQQQHHEWTIRQRQGVERLGISQSELAQAHAELEQATRELGKAKEIMAAVGERERALNGRRADFAQVEGESRCHFCGQELSEEHRAAELKRLAEAALAIEREKTTAQAVLGAVQERFEAARKAEKKAVKAESEIEKEIAEAEREVRHQGDNVVREHVAARAAWDEVGSEARAQWGWKSGELDSLDLSGMMRPDTGDLERMATETKSLKVLESDSLHWQTRVQERDMVGSELARVERELGPLLREWGDIAVEEWHARAARIEEAREAAKLQLEESQSNLEQARAETTKATQDERAVYGRVDELTRQIGPIEGQLMAANGALQAAQIAFDVALGRQNEAALSGEEVSVLRAGCTHEVEKLEGGAISTRHSALVEAHEKLANIEREWKFYNEQIEALPEMARRARAEVEADWSQWKKKRDHSAKEREEVGDTLRRLEREEKERGALEAQLQQRSLEHERWEELARLLGPHQLQRHLLREAERAIVREANGILEGISGGTLRLELVPDSDEGSGNRRPKVLDVMCFHLTGSEEPQAILPAFLSGSQRFRVAVALALGIGRTAARGPGNGRAARVETILIDEGFGALDKTGRDEMKDELRELGRELGRVILVSHQEDFANAFPNRFDITLENGVSRVQKVVE
ncbi:SMC family ATPase [bacterium]|nr:MAG: SMC family ATPase [bacterium]